MAAGAKLSLRYMHSFWLTKPKSPDGVLATACAKCILCRQYASSSKTKKKVTASKGLCSSKVGENHEDHENGTRENAINIQMLSKAIYEQIFHYQKTDSSVDSDKLRRIRNHLKKHDLMGKQTSHIPDVDMKLPPLFGDNIDEHFQELGRRQSKEYVEQAEHLVSGSPPPMPKEWSYTAGWTRYHPDGRAEAVDFPDEEGLVFDVEVLMSEGNFPTIATAASCNHWYSWCSDRLFHDKYRWKKDVGMADLIPMETVKGQHKAKNGWKPRLIVGHNVSFDRSFITEQYFIKGTKARFLDTMSLHIAVSGLTSFQRVLFVAKKKGSHRKELREMEERASYIGPPDFSWTKESSLNNLNDVYQLHCKGEPLEKDKRDVFMKGTIDDVREQFQTLMIYCANDVKATYEVFKKLWPEFRERFPHPVTLAGMLEMGTAYLPVNQNWSWYIQESQATYDDLQQELKKLLMRLANDACQLLHDNRYEKDPWLWDLDWLTKDYKPRVTLSKETRAALKALQKSKEEETVEDRIQRVMTYAKHNIRKINPHMTGYPKWYAELCPSDPQEITELGPGPSKINTLKRVSAKLLRLTWDGYPIHYDATQGWGYLIPGRHDNQSNTEEQEVDDSRSSLGEEESAFPYEAFMEVCRPVLTEACQGALSESSLDQLYEALQDSTDDEEKHKLWKKIAELQNKEQKSKASQTPEGEDHPFWRSAADWPYMRNVAPHPKTWFYKLPHKDGPGNNVGNPLAKDFLSKIEDGTLQAGAGDVATRALTLNKTCAYWKNNKKRISSQMMVLLRKSDLPSTIKRDPDFDEDSSYGAILPRVVTAGTVTRRAMEPTWLTASNAYVDRVGSELKSMVQSPPGYHFVGADVDSQELWIAAILGDANFAGMHGCTALGWMTLQGNKLDRTDLHSRTADLVGISRDQAKVFNYGRIYGAGQLFAERLLRQFNHQLSRDQAKAKARAMFAATKGKRTRRGSKVSRHEQKNGEEFELGKWQGGSESAMFNQLESIAEADRPSTPVLGARISKALEPGRVSSDFMTSRVNWVVQSSAVDYLHLMLVCMRWLLEEFDIDGRFSISIHDEVRYLAASTDRYRAALALQVTNLLTRSMFAYKLGMHDLPQSVAFFSAVDIDTCLRKEVTLDCRTPSNPRGLQRGYGIPPGEALNVYEVLKKTNASLVSSKQPKLEMQKEEDLAEIAAIRS